MNKSAHTIIGSFVESFDKTEQCVTLSCDKSKCVRTSS